MRRTTLSALALALVAAALFGLAACSSPPGPVQPEVGPQAPGVIVFTPNLVKWLDIPNGSQNYSYNDNGFLEFNSVVRNKGSKDMTIALSAYFNDDGGRLVETQEIVDRIFVKSNEEKPVRVAAADKRSKKMRVQVRPAD